MFSHLRVYCWQRKNFENRSIFDEFMKLVGWLFVIWTTRYSLSLFAVVTKSLVIVNEGAGKLAVLLDTRRVAACDVRTAARLAAFEVLLRVGRVHTMDVGVNSKCYSAVNCASSAPPVKYKATFYDCRRPAQGRSVEGASICFMPPSFHWLSYQTWQMGPNVTIFCCPSPVEFHASFAIFTARCT